mgnify:CR=1 FL=1
MVHIFTDSRLIAHDSNTYVAWTLCGYDIQVDEEYISITDDVDCKICLDEQKRIDRDNGQFGVGA